MIKIKYNYKSFVFMLNSLEETLTNLPEIIACQGIWQNEFHKYDVYNHIMAVVKTIKFLTSDLNLIVAAYLHDIGKPQTKKEKKDKEGNTLEKEPGKTYHSFQGHEEEGEKMIRNMNYSFFEEYKLDKEKIARLVGFHYMPLKYLKKMRKAKNYNDFLSSYNELEKSIQEKGIDVNELIILFIADFIGKGNSNKREVTEYTLFVRSLTTDEEESKERYLRRLFNIQQKLYNSG